MRDTQRPTLSELSSRQQATRKKRGRLGTTHTMNHIEDRIREDLSLIRIRFETFDYGDKGRYYTMGYMTALISILLEAMSSDIPENLRARVAKSLTEDNDKLINTEYMPEWKNFFVGRTQAFNNALGIIAHSAD